MSLNDSKIRNLKPSSKPVKLSDSHGLYLLVNPGGSRIWYLKYRFKVIFINLVQNKRDNNRSQAIPCGDGPSRRRKNPPIKSRRVHWMETICWKR